MMVMNVTIVEVKCRLPPVIGSNNVMTGLSHPM